MKLIATLLAMLLLLLSAWLIWYSGRLADPLVGEHPDLQVFRAEDEMGDYWLIRLSQPQLRTRWQGEGQGYQLRIDRLGPQLYNLDVRVYEENRGRYHSWHIESTVRLGPGKTVVAGRLPVSATERASGRKAASRIVIEIEEQANASAAGFFAADR